MKRLKSAAVAAFLLVAVTGCSGKITLLEDGKAHRGTYSQTSETLEVTIDGVPYKGTFTQNASAGVGTGFTPSGQMTTTTMVMSDGSGQALLTSPEGKVLRCVFGPVVGWKGQGQCQNNDGKIYDLLIGQ